MVPEDRSKILQSKKKEEQSNEQAKLCQDFIIISLTFDIVYHSFQKKKSGGKWNLEEMVKVKL